MVRSLSVPPSTRIVDNRDSQSAFALAATSSNASLPVSASRLAQAFSMLTHEMPSLSSMVAGEAACSKIRSAPMSLPAAVGLGENELPFQVRKLANGLSQRAAK